MKSVEQLFKAVQSKISKAVQSKISKAVTFLLSLILMIPTYVYAVSVTQPSGDGGELGSSKFGQGLKKLLEDASAYLLVIAPIVTVLLVIYYFVRKGMAEEHDGKQWTKRIVTAIVCCIGVVCAALLINTLTKYFV